MANDVGNRVRGGRCVVGWVDGWKWCAQDWRLFYLVVENDGRIG